VSVTVMSSTRAFSPHLVPDRDRPWSPGDPIALAPAMVDAIARARAFAPAATPIILHGETGTGKTLLAEYIHRLSGRAGGFHAFPMGTAAPQLAPDELFGHVEGAYTDARRMRAGRIATAGGGTLLLDDMHTLDLGVQKQLLHVLDRGLYSPVGSDRVLSVACRIILAMTENPDTLMERGQLLTDMRYRYGACAIEVPPLRQRRAEIPVLARQTLRDCAAKTSLDGPSDYSEAAMRLLRDAEYKGNVRQLQGIVLAAFLIARDQGASQIEPQHLPLELGTALRYRRHGNPRANQEAVDQALRLTGGSATRAAQLLGVSRTTVNAIRKTALNDASAARRSISLQ